MKKAYEIAAEITPSERQLKWQELEFYAFIHFGMNTFTVTQIGDGFALPETFWPEDFSAESWVETVKAAGMRGLILTCKHHDGFCLWPSEYTDYSVKSSNWQDGKGDIVKDVSLACKKYGIKFGVYLSPWDRHEPTYGTGVPYDEFYKNQLNELLTNYGDVFCVWLDGCYGVGVNGKEQDFDWQGYYKLIRKLQPEAVISITGPDVRWCGNERGVCRRSEWSVVPAYLGMPEFKETDSTENKSKRKAKQLSNTMSLDLGSRKMIKKETEFIWYPAEVDVSIRPNWFFKKDDNMAIKTKDKLLKLYYNSVGANANLLLNIPPDKRGRFHDTDTQILKSLGHELKILFGYNLTDGSSIKASSELSKLYQAENVLNDKNDSFWRPSEDDKYPEIIIEFKEPDLFDKVVLQEHIRNGQHVEEFDLFYESAKGKWKKICKSTIIGHKRICHFKPIRSGKIKIVFKKYRVFMEISKISIN